VLDNELIVFAMGSAVSYWPLYLGLRKAMAKRRARSADKVTSLPIAEANRDFLSLLHREAVLRASAVLRDALGEAKASTRAAGGKNSGLCLSTRQRLEDIQKLIRSLSLTSSQALFSAAIEQIATVTIYNTQSVSKRVSRTIKALEESLVPNMVHNTGKNGIVPTSHLP
jgi:hypothetical protein